MEHTVVVLWAAFGIGLVFGAVGQRIEFCFSGGLREWWRDKDPRRAGAVLLAMAVALAGSQVVAALGYVDLSESIYIQPGFSWLLVPVGGLVFGYGMIVARGCGARALVLLPDGNLRSLVVLLCLGISAYAALTGVLASWRLTIAEATMVTPGLPVVSVPGVLESWGMPSGVGWMLPTILLAGGLSVYALVGLKLIRHPWQAVGAGVVGLTIPAGWVVTGHLGADDFDPVRVESLTFVAPIGDSIQYLMLSTGTPMVFGVAVVGGVLLGSLAVSLSTGAFETRSFERPGDMVRSAGGGVMMGIGGALALGCSVGQGMSGFSTLALPSFLAVAAIFAGAFLAVRGPLRVS